MPRRKKIIILSVVIVLIVFLAPAIYLISKYLVNADINQTASLPTYGNIPATGTFLKGRTSISKSGAVYTFSFIGGEDVTYILDLRDPNIKKGLLKILAKIGANEFYPISVAGPNSSDASGNPSQSPPTSTLISDQLTNSNRALILTYSDQFSSSITRTRTTKIKPMGKSLQITFNSQGGSGADTSFVDEKSNYAGLSLGSPSGASGLKTITVPYMPDVPIAQVGNAFFSSFIDKTQSHATDLKKPETDNNTYIPEAVVYNKDHDGKVSNLNEVAYITVSSKIEHTFPYPNNPIAPHPKRQSSISGLFVVNDKLPSKVAPKTNNDENSTDDNAPSCQDIPAAPTVDNPTAQMPIPVSGESFNRYYFDNTKVFLEMINQMGINDIVYIGNTNWGQSPGPELTPKRLPICERSGGEARYERLIQTAKNLGMHYLDHETWFQIAKKYTDPNNPAYDETLAFYTTKKSNNQYLPHGTAGKDYSVSPDGLPTIAKATINKLAGNLGLSGTFLDTSPSFVPTRLGNINLGSENKNSRNLAEAIVNMKKFFVYLNENFVGPIVGEGGKGWDRFDSYYAGFIDGVEREHDDHKNGAIIPDFELKNVAPKSPLNYGMGWHERWECQDSGESNCAANFNTFDFNRYRAQTISFGHPAYLPDAMNLNLRDGSGFQKYLRQFTDEYYLIQQLQTQYVGTKISSIDYFDSSGQIGDLSIVYKTKPDYDFKNDKIKLVYANGLTILVNNDQSQNWSVSTEAGNYDLPPNGFIAFNKNQKGWQGNGNFLAYSAIVNGRRADYVSSQDYIFTNDRGGAGLKATKSDGLQVVCTGDNDAPKCETI